MADNGLEIGFGRSREGAVRPAARLIGPPSASAPCVGGGAVVAWPIGLAMHFPRDVLAGWKVEGRSAGRLCALS